ncbi:hypothetical protein IZ6_26060 [Terrihabitans soli]|uniref:DNA gyrase inhibitor YacG n=1 Tax=Terrihabitans soli TaxID=708113 RepID=A0A6S6QXW4_9HYPH|nr:DNA gyrase inhibitor YacG [Terrihabitans soli]BCJ91871.1 hypothetical protein IZ6_26060 [Terrihabitans soli]
MPADVSNAGKAAKPRCPICGKPAVAAHIPFCSTKCADIDLNRWLGGEYRIPTDERPDAAPPPEGED